MQRVDDPSEVADLAGYASYLTLEHKRELLETPDVATRLERATEWAREHLAEQEVSEKIRDDVREGMDKAQREFLLHRFVNDVAYYLCLCHYGGLWHPLAVTVGGQVAGFCMWAVDDDASRWIGGVVVDAGRQRQGIGRALIVALRDRLAAEPGVPNVALSYLPENTAARSLYLSLGFVETGEREGDELIARFPVPTR